MQVTLIQILVALASSAAAFQQPQLLHKTRFTTRLCSTPVKDLPLPPQKGGVGRRVRDLVGYMKDPDGFIRTRSNELGPIFRMYYFFKPVVVVGGQEGVNEFAGEREIQSKVITSDMPDPFKELHTKWGALNMDPTDEIYQQARAMFRDVLTTSDALNSHTKTLEPFVEEYVEDLVQRVKEDPDQEFFLVPELKDFCLQAFSKIFTGKGLTPEQVQMYIDYNNALLSLSKRSKGFEKGKEALETLKAENIERFAALEDLPEDAPGKFLHSKLTGREGFEDPDRIGVATLLFVWAAYAESAALVCDAMVLLLQESKVGARDGIVAELQRVSSSPSSSSSSKQDYKFWKSMKYTVGVLRETLRLRPPSASVPRYGDEDFALQGYRVPARLAVIMDPRYGNVDPNVFVEPLRFEPNRWVKNKSGSSSSCPFAGTALSLGKGSFFPGSYGAHQCPGIGLSELVCSMLLAKISNRFESWSLSGSGLSKDGDVQYVTIPIKIPNDNLGFKFKLAETDTTKKTKDEEALIAC